MVQRITKTINLKNGEPEQKRRDILKYFHDTFDLDEKLFESLRRDETYFINADPLRHPLIFYFGHTAAFFINKLILAKILDQRIDSKFESIFAVGVDEMSWDDLNEAYYDWPSVQEVRSYREEVRKTVDHLIKNLPLTLPTGWEDPLWVVLMGIEHARIHLETSSVLIRQLPIDEVIQTDFWDYYHQWGNAPENELLPIPAGNVKLGKPNDHQYYGWDNEYGNREEYIKTFNASKYLVSNQEFMKFVEADGYHIEQYWTEEGWNWKKYQKTEYPRFWLKAAGKWKFRTMLSIIEMPWNWPAEVNYLEAKAFCNWLSAKTGKILRLPTEAEWYRFYEHHNLPDQPEWKLAPGNINLEFKASSYPVDHFKFQEFYDVIGNVWQWTETPFYGFPGFRVHPYYDDFSTPTFDNLHNLIKGGSWISTGNAATRSSRYAFRRHFYQHAGFRYLETAELVKKSETSYEEEADVTPYCEMHWGKEYFNVPNFSKRLAELALNSVTNDRMEQALCIGCKVGRTAFELARKFSKVTGIDFTARHLKSGVNMRDNGILRYTLREEGELVSYHEKKLQDFGLREFAERVVFFQGDISNLNKKFNGYDLVLVENALESAYNPRNFLNLIQTRLKNNAMLIIASTYDWLEKNSNSENRIGGFRKDGEPFTSLSGLTEILDKHFLLQAPPLDLPYVLRETSRNYHYGISQVTIWKKR